MALLSCAQILLSSVKGGGYRRPDNCKIGQICVFSPRRNDTTDHSEIWFGAVHDGSILTCQIWL